MIKISLKDQRDINKSALVIRECIVREAKFRTESGLIDTDSLSIFDKENNEKIDISSAPDEIKMMFDFGFTKGIQNAKSGGVDPDDFIVHDPIEGKGTSAAKLPPKKRLALFSGYQQGLSKYKDLTMKIIPGKDYFAKISTNVTLVNKEESVHFNKGDKCQVISVGEDKAKVVKIIKHGETKQSELDTGTFKKIFSLVEKTSETPAPVNKDIANVETKMVGDKDSPESEKTPETNNKVSPASIPKEIGQRYKIIKGWATEKGKYAKGEEVEFKNKKELKDGSSVYIFFRISDGRVISLKESQVTGWLENVVDETKPEEASSVKPPEDTSKETKPAEATPTKAATEVKPQVEAPPSSTKQPEVTPAVGNKPSDSKPLAPEKKPEESKPINVEYKVGDKYKAIKSFQTNDNVEYKIGDVFIVNIPNAKTNNKPSVHFIPANKEGKGIAVPKDIIKDFLTKDTGKPTETKPAVASTPAAASKPPVAAAPPAPQKQSEPQQPAEKDDRSLDDIISGKTRAKLYKNQEEADAEIYAGYNSGKIEGPVAQYLLKQSSEKYNEKQFNSKSFEKEASNRKQQEEKSIRDREQPEETEKGGEKDSFDDERGGVLPDSEGNAAISKLKASKSSPKELEKNFNMMLAGARKGGDSGKKDVAKELIAMYTELPGTQLAIEKLMGDNKSNEDRDLAVIFDKCMDKLKDAWSWGRGILKTITQLDWVGNKKIEAIASFDAMKSLHESDKASIVRIMFAWAKKYNPKLRKKLNKFTGDDTSTAE